jgi:hypothetical protein
MRYLFKKKMKNTNGIILYLLKKIILDIKNGISVSKKNGISEFNAFKM